MTVPKRDESDPLAALARELGRKTRFRWVGEAAVLAVLRTAALMRRELTPSFEAAGLTMAQYNVLRILRGARDGLPTLQIRRRMLEEGAGITRLVDKLSEDGLIERDRPGGDRRRVVCRITRKGLDLLDRHERRIDEAHGDLVSGMGEGDARELVRLLMKAGEYVRKRKGARA
jgi:DNA-binding MarR family transcriptional regulator